MQPITDEELERARRMFRRVFGDDYGGELCAQLGEGEFNQVLMCRIAPQVWEADAVPLPSKILCAIVLLAAAHQDCRYFIRAAIHHGISRRQVEEVLLLAGLESGFPAAGTARRAVEQGYQDHLGMLARLGKPRRDW
jgi:alkylhydroperoxidase/carboxymuconolactone decarboxylase family protein YurZ